MQFGDNLKSIREKHGMTLDEMARNLGTTKQALSRYERGERTPKITAAAKFAEVLGVSLEDLMGNMDLLPSSVMQIKDILQQSVPLIGEVAAGQPITAEESYDVYVDSPVKADYALRVKGDSMNPTYLDGDVVYIRMVESVPEGTVAVVLLDNDACLKHVYYIPNGVQLVSDNPAYPPMICTWPEYDNIRVLGKVVGYTRMYK